MCARIVWPFSSSTAKVVLGKTCLIVPKSSIVACFVGSAGPLDELSVAVRRARLYEAREAMTKPQ